ncbi:class I SAM-dependent methyltransferase [Trujillonella humicola]|uniref:class I SAM-dependent methyltransferase n=1 Tax=Trujillonella humicola TaxID=3383699 RepID=UPI003906864C
MLMNRAETILVNSGARRALQRWYETPTLLRLGGQVAPGGRALELGCGAGYGTELVLERFGADRVDAVDLDPEMVDRARRRLARHGARVRLAVGDVTDLRRALDVLTGDVG